MSLHVMSICIKWVINYYYRNKAVHISLEKITSFLKNFSVLPGISGLPKCAGKGRIIVFKALLKSSSVQ